MWLRILERALTPTRSMLFGYWLRGDSRRPAEFRQECDARDKLPEPLNELRRAVDALPYGDAPGVPPPSKKRSLASLHTALSVGSAALALLAIGAVLFVSLNIGGSQRYATSIGEYERRMLSDGSAVELNTNTEIRLRVTEHQREIELVRGEANFKVAHDATRPFIVRAGDTLIRATGTEFTVRMHDTQRVGILVTDGTVIVSHDPLNDHMPRLSSNRGQPARRAKAVAAGEIATDDRGQIAAEQIRPSDIEARQSWRHGLLIFRDQPLREVVAELNRYNGSQLIVADSLADQRVGGQFRTTDPDVFLRRLATIKEIRMTRSRSRVSGGEVIYLDSLEDPSR